MTRRLEDLQIPWLTREQLEAAIWRLTGARNQHAVDELLWAADVYAVSQGPLLARKLAETKRSRRWLSLVPSEAAALTEAEQPERQIQHAPDQLLSDSYDATWTGQLIGTAEPDEEEDFGEPILTVGMAPPKSVPVREQHGVMEQFCKACDNGIGRWKPLDEFGKDSDRWNGRATQCKKCRNAQQKARKQHRQAGTSAG